jgi:hypothetical protein
MVFFSISGPTYEILHNISREGPIQNFHITDLKPWTKKNHSDERCDSQPRSGIGNEENSHKMPKKNNLLRINTIDAKGTTIPRHQVEYNKPIYTLKYV